MESQEKAGGTKSHFSCQLEFHALEIELVGLYCVEFFSRQQSVFFLGAFDGNAFEAFSLTMSSIDTGYTILFSAS